MSPVPRSPAVRENEHFREVPSSATKSDSVDNVYKVIVSNETNVISVVGPSTSHCIAIASELVGASTSQNEYLNSEKTAPESSSENPVKKKAKVKTEPANAYFQFIQSRKKAELAINPNYQVNLSEQLRTEWRDFNEDQKIKKWL